MVYEQMCKKYGQITYIVSVFKADIFIPICVLLSLYAISYKGWSKGLLNPYSPYRLIAHLFSPSVVYYGLRTRHLKEGYHEFFRNIDIIKHLLNNLILRLSSLPHDLPYIVSNLVHILTIQGASYSRKTVLFVDTIINRKQSLFKRAY